MEFILFITLFLLIFWLQKDIAYLKREISTLKRDRHCEASDTISEQNSLPIAMPLQVDLPSITEQARLIIESVQQIEPPKIPTPKKEYTPNLFDKLALLVKNYFTSGNIIVRIGGVILFFGLAFLAKFAAEHSVISMEVRLFAIALVAVVLVGIGWRLRKREGYYGLILQGIGIAVFYLVIFSASKMYYLMPLSLAFGLMLCIVIAGVILSVMQNALPLALFSITGGFLTPILTSDGSGSHIMLFSYYTLLNLGIVLIAWYRSWRVLNLTGFFFTFVIATAWGVLRYDSDYLMSCELFLITFYLFYLVVSILFSAKQTFTPRALIDSTLVFGLPFIAFSFQVSLVESIKYALAWSSFALGTLYIALYFLLRSKERLQLLTKSFLALGIIFYTVMIPYIFGTQFTATLWALEGTAVLYIALRQEQTLVRYFGQALVLIATVVYLASSLPYMDASIAYLNTTYLGFIFLIASTLFCAYLLDNHQHLLKVYEKNNALIFLFLGMLTWLSSGVHDAQILDEKLGNIMLLFLTVWGIIFGAIGHYFRWSPLKVVLQGYLPLGMLFFIRMIDTISHPFEGIGGVVLIAFFSVHYILLYRFDSEWKLQPLLHIASFWAIVLLLAQESYYQTTLLSTYPTWSLFAWITVVSLFALVLIFSKTFLPNGFKHYQSLYTSVALNGLIMMLSVAILYSFNYDANIEFGYLPLLNPIDLSAFGVFFLFYKWINNQNPQTRQPFIVIFSGMALLFVSVVLARSIHAFVGIDYDLFTLLGNKGFQMGLSILWSLIALGTILVAKRFQNHILWLAGASLMGVVVIKLFLVELSNSGSIERIVSFIVVGVLLLLIGYFAPLPPKHKSED